VQPVLQFQMYHDFVVLDDDDDDDFSEQGASS
jgi:hypothetical protein